MQTIDRFYPNCAFGRRPLLAAMSLALVIALGLPLAAFMTGPAFAIELNLGPVSGSIDTTLSAGATFRTEDPDPDLIGAANGGTRWSINGDDGNQNFAEAFDFSKWNPVSCTLKATHELQLSWRNLSFFGRAFYFYDFAIMEYDSDRTRFSDSAKKNAGANAKVLDLYMTADFEVLDRTFSIRAGNQVVSWGESTFIQNGINVINPVDVSQLRAAGSELREAFIPVPLILLSANVTDNLSVEGVYQLHWNKTEIEPSGTFFSTNDFASPGGNTAYLGFGVPYNEEDPAEGGPRDNPRPPAGSNPPVGWGIPRADDLEPSDQGQFGVALRYFAPWLNDTEFGFYYMRYHSRLPIISGRTGTPPPDAPEDPASILEWLSHIDLIQYGLLNGDYASTSNYLREYPEDINVVGMGFNSTIGNTGIAIQGEISYRDNQPLQIDDVEVLTHAVSPMDSTLVALTTLETLLGMRDSPAPDTIFGNSQLGTAGFNQIIHGYRRKQMVQPQMTLTKLFGPMLGADQAVLIGEIGATWIPDMESKDELRYEGPGTFTSANPFFTHADIQPATQQGGFADDFSWGYRAACRLDFNNAVGPVNLQPAVAFYHDVQGTSPSPVLNFVDGRMTLSASLTGTYLERLKGKIAYTSYFGGGEFNLVSDRDHFTISASYSF